MSGRRVRIRKRLDRISLIWATRIFRIVYRMLPYRFGVRAGGALGLAAYYLLSRERKRAIAHLSAAFQDRDDGWIRSTARRSFIHLGKALAEILLMTPRRLSKFSDFRGEDGLGEALARGKGVIVVASHIGNWEIFGGALAAKAPVSAVAAPIVPDEVNKLVIDMRTALGIKTILRGKPGATRELIRVFKENRILGILIDQDTDVEGAFVEFMGMPAWTPTAAASMAIKFNAPVVFGYMKRGKGDRLTAVIEGPLELRLTGDTERDVVVNTAMFTKKIENCIKEDPEQWVWMHRRWRRQP